MRTQVHHEGNGDQAHPVFQIETDEDCAMAEQRFTSLKSSARSESEDQELHALGAALDRWHSGRAKVSDGREK